MRSNTSSESDCDTSRIWPRSRGSASTLRPLGVCDMAEPSKVESSRRRLRAASAKSKSPPMFRYSWQSPTGQPRSIRATRLLSGRWLPASAAGLAALAPAAAARARCCCLSRSCTMPARCTARVLVPTPGRAPSSSTLRREPSMRPPLAGTSSSRCTTSLTSCGATVGSTKSLTPARRAAMAPSGWLSRPTATRGIAGAMRASRRASSADLNSLPGSSSLKVKSRNTTCGSISARRLPSSSTPGTSWVSRPMSPSACPSCAATPSPLEQNRNRLPFCKPTHSLACVFISLTVRNPAFAARRQGPSGNSPKR